MEKQKSDINFFASMTAIPSTYRDQITMGLPTEVKAEDITLIGGLNGFYPDVLQRRCKRRRTV